MRIARTLTITLLAAGAPVSAARAQRLSLGDALAAAARDAYPNRAARGETAARAGEATASLRGILPTIRAEAGWTRTTDPLAAFGIRLQERIVTGQDFDPARLNRPAAIGTYPAAVVVEQPLVDLDALAGRTAAREARDAADVQRAWTHDAVALDVIRAYYGVLLARARAATLDDAARAARAHTAQARSALRNGVVTRSDVLLADVRSGDVDVQLAAAAADTTLARRRLAVAIGAPLDRAIDVGGRLPDDSLVNAAADSLAGADTVTPRADVQAAALAADAAHDDHLRARAALLPRLNAFAQLGWASPIRPLAGAGSWTAGLVLSWTPFNAGMLGDVQTTSGRAAAARAGADGAAAAAALEREQTASALAVARARLTIAARSVDQSAEAHRIVSRKYDGGLASITELLDAAAAETHTRLALADARVALILAIAERRHALGLDLTPIATLDAASRR